MLLRMESASVENPVEVRIGGAPERARAWYARKMNPNVSMRNNCCLATAPIIRYPGGTDDRFVSSVGILALASHDRPLTFFLDSAGSRYTGNPKRADSTCETEMPGCQRKCTHRFACNVFNRAHGKCWNRRRFAPVR